MEFKLQALFNYAHLLIGAKQAGHDVATRLDAALDKLEGHMNAAFVEVESEVQHAGDTYDKVVADVNEAVAPVQA